MIRDAKKSDFLQIYSLYRYFTKHLIKKRPNRYSIKRVTEKNSLKEFNEYIKDKKNSKIIVYEVDGKIVAYGIGGVKESRLFEKPKHYGLLDIIVVRKDYQNKGIGKELALYLVNWMKKKKIKLVYGIVDVANVESKRVWSKIGFKDELIYIAKDIY